MARYTGAVCRLCRREGLKLFLKGERCYTDKCAIERRNYPPGQHGQARPEFSEYSIQLREKQKLRRIYGVLEGQFRRYFQMADRAKGVTGETLLQLLERRMDNMVYRMGFATSRSEARQLVRHGHFHVNGRKVMRIQEAIDLAQRRGVPDWLEVSPAEWSGRVKTIPVRQDLTMPINEKLVVELYSK